MQTPNTMHLEIFVYTNTMQNKTNKLAFGLLLLIIKAIVLFEHLEAE